MRVYSQVGAKVGMHLNKVGTRKYRLVDTPVFASDLADSLFKAVSNGTQ